MKNAKGLLDKLKNLFCYCGLTRDEYHAVRKEAYAANFYVWKYLDLMLAVSFLAIFFTMIGHRDRDTAQILLLSIVGYSAISAALFHFVLKKESLAAQFMIYGSMVLLMLYGLYAGLAYPSMMSVTFIVMLVLLPMFFIGRPCWMATFLVVSVLVNALLINGKKDPDVYRLDVINSIAYGTFGVMISAFYCFIRMRQFILQHHENEHLEEHRRTAEETSRLNETLRKTCEGLIEVMGDVVESRDPDSGEHIKRVKGYTYLLANEMMRRYPSYGLDPYMVDLITAASALHDVGKITIPDAILNKPGKLTKEEFEVMKSHCESGCHVLEKMRDRWSTDYLETGLEICRHHHEKWDGRGYPDGLKGNDIPIAAQIVSVTDVFDALTTKRVYKDAFTPEKAFEMIRNGECGTFSPALLECLEACREGFIMHYRDPSAIRLPERPFELISRTKPEDSFVLGFHDEDKTLRERVRMSEELSVLESLSEELLYVCYVDIPRNEVVRIRADKRVSCMLDSYGDTLRSYERFDRLLNSVIVKEDYARFREETERVHATERLKREGSIYTDFRIRLQDGIHFCRLKMSQDKSNENAVVVGISIRDREHRREEEYEKMRQELALARQEMENREKLADRLAVIDCISSNYDYVCSLNAKTMEVVVYRAEDWIRDMFKNLEDIVVSPEVRSATLKGIILPEDFDRFNEQSRHSAVMEGLKKNGVYNVNYRAYKYGRLVNYQTRYTLDPNNPTRIVIGLCCTDNLAG